MSTLVLPSVNRPYVEALHQVADTSGTWSVIGGFAVWCHLGESHRPTLDIDTAAAARAHETLVSLGEPGDDKHRRIVEGVKLEIIEVHDPGPEVSDLDDKNRLFVRMLQTSDWDALADDARDDRGLATVVSWAAASVLVDQSARVSRLVQVHTDSEPPSPSDVRSLGESLLELL